MTTVIIDKVIDVLDRMDPIDLEEMNHVKLMRRKDTKYVISTDQLPLLLEQVHEDYKVFVMKGKRLQRYKTVYFDTPHLRMYMEHHNKRKNRFKVRMRQYMLSGQSFLEIKFKNNRGETIKKRVEAELDTENLEPENDVFLAKYSPYSFDEIEPALWNSFERITLVSKYRPERLTIDIGLEFTTPCKTATQPVHETCVIEVKRDLDAGASDFANILHKERIKEVGFSKYCMGTVLTNGKVKHNLFKKRLRQLGLYKHV